MKKINYNQELKGMIQVLETKKTLECEELKEQFHTIRESLKPANIIKNMFSKTLSSHSWIDNAMDSAIGLTTGYLSKKILVAGSGNIIRKMLGSIVQVGVTNVASRNADVIKSVGGSVLDLFLKKKITNTNHDEQQ